MKKTIKIFLFYVYYLPHMYLFITRMILSSTSDRKVVYNLCSKKDNCGTLPKTMLTAVFALCSRTLFTIAISFGKLCHNMYDKPMFLKSKTSSQNNNLFEKCSVKQCFQTHSAYSSERKIDFINFKGNIKNYKQFYKAKGCYSKF